MIITSKCNKCKKEITINHITGPLVDIKWRCSLCGTHHINDAVDYGWSDEMKEEFTAACAETYFSRQFVCLKCAKQFTVTKEEDKEAFTSCSNCGEAWFIVSNRLSKSKDAKMHCDRCDIEVDIATALMAGDGKVYCTKACQAGDVSVPKEDCGRKFDDGKLRYDLIPPDCYRELVKIITYGANKYAPNNWQKVERDRYIAALYRHVESWRMGETSDEESSHHHLAHAMCNVMFLLWKDMHNVE